MMVKKRSEVDLAKTWSMEDLYENEALWEADFLELERLVEDYETYRGKLGESGEYLLGCFALDEAVGIKLDRVYSYASCQQDVDMENPHYQAMQQRAMRLAMRASAASAFISAEVLAIPEERLQTFCEEVSELARFDRTLEVILRDKPHTRSAEVEELLAEAAPLGRASYETFGMLSNADMRFPQVVGEDGEMAELTQERYGGLIQSRNREVRRDAFMAMHQTYGKQKNTLAANYGANVKQAAFFAKARRYGTAREYYLSGSQIPESVYDQLIEAVHDGLPAMYRYVRLRKEMLHLPDVHLYDVYTPLVGEAEWEVSFEEACHWIKEALKPLGEVYGSILDQAFAERWIDYAENQGKRSGAYSGGGYGTHPYILMTYKNKLNDVFTLVHELGHSVHTYLSNQAQTYHNAQYRIFVAETASTCNEALLNHYLLQIAKTPEQKAYLINHYLDHFKGTLFRQTMFAEFERNMHQAFADGIPLTVEYLCSQYRELNALYFGPDLVIDEEVGMEWARIPHFYRPFYVYQYATGFSAAIALARKILEEGTPAVEKYLTFLSGGCTKDPIDLLKDAGVDMTSKEPVLAAMEEFREWLGQLENL